MNRHLTLGALAVGCILFTGCASKKDLQNCQSQNQQLTADYQSARETKEER